MNMKALSILTTNLFAITSIAGVTLLSLPASATDTTTAQDNVAVSVPVSCTMNGTGMTSHTASIPNGTYESGIGTTTLKSFCNDNQGFAIYAVGYSNETIGNTTLIGASQGQTIVTGTATTTGNPDVSNWAVKLETSSSATYPLTLDNGFGSYSNVPSSYTKVAHRDSGTDLGSSATGATLTTTYASYISKTQKADTYNGKVKYTLVHPANEAPIQPVDCEARKICYNPNTATATGEMGKQSRDDSDYTITPGSSVTLWAPNFERNGYGFAGWNTEYDYSGTNYGPQQTIDAPADITTNGLSLYAVWIESAGSLQNWTGCNSLASGATTALTDERDGNTYAVAKLADGKCWMIENLRLDDASELSSTNTHNPSLPLTNNYVSSTTSNHLSTATNPINTAWCATITSSCIDQSMLATNNTTLFTSNTSSSYNAESNVYSYGNYYNWYSATAGHGKYNWSYGDDFITPGDICPAGWHLPTGHTMDVSGEFSALDIALGGSGESTIGSDAGMAMSQAYRYYPNNFVYSGQVDDTSIYGRNSSGYYWSASGDSDSDAKELYFHYAYLGPGTSVDSKYDGGVVRCIAGV